MQRSSISRGTFVGVLILAVLFLVGFLFADQPLTWFTNVAAGNPMTTAAIFSVLMFVATVVAPVTVFPIIPITAVVIGPLPTALLSVTAWTSGAIVAFLFARHLGRPMLERFVSLEEIERYEQYVPTTAQFFWVVVLRMVLPVDVLSYAIGLFSSMPVLSYSVATLIGVTPFSLVLAYVGPAIVEGQFAVAALLAGAVLVAVLVGDFLWWRGRRKK